MSDGNFFVQQREEAEKAAEEARAERIKEVVGTGLQGEGYRRFLH